MHFTDQGSVAVDGQSVTVCTATSDKSLDGSIGCPKATMAVGDCFGFQPDLILRRVVVDVGDHPMVAWMRSVRTSNPDE